MQGLFFFLCAVIFLLLNFLVRSQEQNAFVLPWHVPGKQSLRVKRLFSYEQVRWMVKGCKRHKEAFCTCLQRELLF